MVDLLESIETVETLEMALNKALKGDQPPTIVYKNLPFALSRR
jgi:hypothetical protein